MRNAKNIESLPMPAVEAMAECLRENLEVAVLTQDCIGPAVAFLEGLRQAQWVVVREPRQVARQGHVFQTYGPKIREQILPALRQRHLQLELEVEASYERAS